MKIHSNQDNTALKHKRIFYWKIQFNDDNTECVFLKEGTHIVVEGIHIYVAYILPDKKTERFPFVNTLKSFSFFVRQYI